MAWSPWQEAAQYPEIMIHRCSLDEGSGWWSPAYQVILLEESLDPITERCVLAHELGHALLGHSGVDPETPHQRFFAYRIEAAADSWAAERLINSAELVEAMALHRGDLGLVAASLEVTPAVLEQRLQRLPAADRELIAARLAQAE
ncbi:MAG: ImmA/IrrE family metallo-endopeptidase [Angustibacter sp.]